MSKYFERLDIPTYKTKKKKNKDIPTKAYIELGTWQVKYPIKNKVIRMWKMMELYTQQTGISNNTPLSHKL